MSSTVQQAPGLQRGGARNYVVEKGKPFLEVVE
jgi:hypothetical protein